MSHPYSKEAKEGHARKLKAYGGQSGNQPLTHAGFPALNTDTQAGRAPLNSPNYIPPEVTPRVGRKKGGKVVGAQSLKRLDKSPRKGKSSAIPTGTRAGEIPSGTTEQVEFDPTIKFEPGKMSESSPRKSGGSCMKKGGKIQDYEARSHESQGAQGLRPRQGHAKGGSAMHDDEAMDRKLVKKMVKGDALTGKKMGGRTCKADGGSLGAFSDYGMSGGSDKKHSPKKGDGKTTVNIMVGGPQPQQPGVDPMMLAAMAGGPQGGPPPMAPPPMAPPGAGAPPPAMVGAPPPAPVGGPPMPPQGGLPIGRKDGGSVQVPYKKPSRKGDYPAMDFGSGGGFGRKQKIDAYGTKGPSSKDNY